MQKFIAIVFFIMMFFSSPSFSSMNGQGPLNIKNDILDVLLNYYFNPKNKRDRPTHFTITKTGDMLGYSVCPARYAGDCHKTPQTALIGCRKNVKKYLKRKERCWIFAKARKIVWNNLNIEIPKGTSNSAIKEILMDNGFLENKPKKKKSTKTKKETKKVIKKKSTNNDSVVDQIKQLKQLLDDGVLTQKEFEKAKKKVLN